MKSLKEMDFVLTEAQPWLDQAQEGSNLTKHILAVTWPSGEPFFLVGCSSVVPAHPPTGLF